jgi:hypothetical protein
MLRQIPHQTFLDELLQPIPFGELHLQCFPDTAPHLAEAEELGLTSPPSKIRTEQKISIGPKTEALA